jgi:hypothetical protein
MKIKRLRSFSLNGPLIAVWIVYSIQYICTFVFFTNILWYRGNIRYFYRLHYKYKQPYTRRASI